MKIYRWAASLWLCLTISAFASAEPATMRITADPDHPLITEWSWDTEGGSQARLNLLRRGTGAGLRIKVDETWFDGKDLAAKVTKDTIYRLQVGTDAELTWQFATNGGQMQMSLSAKGAGWKRVQGLELVFPFDPYVAATTVLPASWDAEGKFHLPAIISAPDFGQLLVTANDNAALKGRLTGSRSGHTIDLTIEFPVLHDGEKVTLTFQPVYLPQPVGLSDPAMWRAARRPWFNAFQCSAQWGDQNNPVSAPAGILANNVISDPVSCLMHVWADQILLTPQFSTDIKLSGLVRRTVDWWLDNRTKPTGEVIAYWNYADMLDANASPLIAAWDYVEASHDKAWLARRIERLEFVAGYILRRDTDDDGLIESTHSGNAGTLVHPMRAASAYDTINSGYKDAYSNAFIYRAFRCLADLETQLDRHEQARLYTQRADRLKAAYVKTLFNPKTGWLAWWKSEDGQLHDLSSPVINGLAIHYGLVEPKQAREILNRLWTAMEAAGFQRFDLGVPVTLKPIPRGDYISGIAGHGVPTKEDGSDTFGQYLNGGCLVGDTIDFVAALYDIGETAKGDLILRAMLKRQTQSIFPNGGSFQNGVVNHYPAGAEFFTWDGQTCGYEGHLTYNYTFLQGIFLREPAFRVKLFRPLNVN